jgi:succinate dehydrogenase / fumarate reductase flavoprotein subunit
LNKFTDVLIIGSGIAGLRASLEASKYSNNVKIISKLPVMRSHSVSASGGINSVSIPDDSIQSYIDDTIKGSDYLADQDSVTTLVNHANIEIKYLENIGVNFDKSDKAYSTNKLGGAKFSRALNSSTQIGFSIMQGLYDEVKNNDIPILENWHVLDLLIDNNRCYGLIALNKDNNEVQRFFSHLVIIATGPAGHIYSNTTNSTNCTGDGVAIAYRAGALLQDMEFVQFHPTSLLGSNILITERSRSAGAYLLNKNGERFMSKYAPSSLELAPRDIVSRSILTEINDNRGLTDPDYGNYVELSFTHLSDSIIDEKLPDVKDLASSLLNIDIKQTPLKIIPAQHYMMGGIRINANCKTSISHLYAAGECSCPSVHGANRLGGNSLIECLVFGKIAGSQIKNHSKTHDIDINSLNFHYDISNYENMLNNIDSEHVNSICSKLQSLMTSNVGIFRTKKLLKQSLVDLSDLKKQVLSHSSNSYDNSKSSSHSYFELLNMFDVSETIIFSSIIREESRGSHYRLDFPSRNDKDWLNHILIQLSNSNIQSSFEPVIIDNILPESRSY